MRLCATALCGGFLLECNHDRWLPPTMDSDLSALKIILDCTLRTGTHESSLGETGNGIIQQSTGHGRTLLIWCTDYITQG